MNHAPLFIRAWNERQRSSLLAVSFLAFAALFLFSLLRANPVQAATCHFVSNGDNDFNTAANWDCGRVPQGGDDVLIRAGTSTNMSSSASFSTLSASGTINVLTATLTVTSTVTVWLDGSVTSSSGTMDFNSVSGNTSSSGAIGGVTSTGAILITGSFYNNGTFGVGSGSATTTGSLSIGPLGRVNNHSGTLSVGLNFFYVTGTYAGGTGTFRLVGGSDQSIAGSSFYNLASNKTAGTATFVTSTVSATGTLMTANAGTLNFAALTFTVTGASTIGSGTTVTSTSGAKTFTGAVTNAGSLGAISGNTLMSSTLTNSGTWHVGAGTATTTGLITNTGTMTRASAGTILHTAESTKISDSDGTEVSSIATDGSLYVNVQDSNRNMDGTTAETMTVYVTGDSSSGSDSETLTLTETGVATGIFRSSAVRVVNSGTASVGNGQFEIASTGVGSLAYTDNQDAADTGSDTVTLSYTAASAAASTGGGGVGGGGSIPIATTYQVSVQSGQSTTQGNLANLTTIGVSVHNLVKLPDDGDASTQADSAVYYVGSDGKRHAFPNSKVYGTWYANFDGVQVVNQTQLASIPLGSNVTYKPADRMVKFTTDPKTYVVGKGGVLRWVKTEAAAIELYGAAWNTVIDDINDAFYANYTFGTDVTGLVDFNPTTVEASVSQPSDSLVM